MEEESIGGNLMTTFRKMVSSTKLLFLIHLNKTEKPKKLTALLKALFWLFSLNKNFLSCYGLSLQKQ